LASLSETNPREEIAFIGINIVREICQKLNLSLRAWALITRYYWISTRRLMHDLNVSIVPTLVIVNDDGEILYMHERFAPAMKNSFREKLIV
jgi:hypothetical protein